MTNTKTPAIDTKTIFNALANAKHIYAYKEEGTAFKLLKLVNTDEATKAVVMTEDGEICGLFTDSQSAKSALQEVQAVFGDDQPFITVHIKETAKKQYRDWETDRKSTRLNSSHEIPSRMPSSA